MKASILTFSQTGNTLKVANSIANVLQNNGIEVEHIRFLHRDKWNPDDADIIGIGAPCFENHPAECVTGFLKNCKYNFNGKKAFVFITSGESPAKTLWHLANSVSKIGAKVIGGVQLRGAVTVPTMFGRFLDRPNETDLQYAKCFGKELSNNLLHNKPISEIYKVDSKKGGNFYNTIGPWLTYFKKKVTPLPKCDPNICTLCGNCVYECPTKSIKIEKQHVVFNNSCIVCYRCWHVCPENAISIKFSPGNGFIERNLYCEKMALKFGNLQRDEDFGINLYKDVLGRRIKLKYNRKKPTAEFEVMNAKQN